MYIKSVNDKVIGWFKKGYQPLWESCPDSGCWLLRFKITEDMKEINFKWEKDVCSLIG